MQSQEEKIQQLAESLIQDKDKFVVDVTVASGPKIVIYVDGDQGVTIEELVKLNRAIYKQLVEDGVYEDGAFALDVSSPGLDMPLKLPRQYQKNIGRLVQVISSHGTDEGRMVEVADDKITIEKKSKKETKRVEVPFEDIIKTKILVEF